MNHDKASTRIDPAYIVNYVAEWRLHIQTYIIVSVSGGLDSMTLWHLVRRAGLRHVVTHVNFGLRGEDSDADEALVRATAAEHGIAFYPYAVDLDGDDRLRRVQTRARDARISLTKALSRTLGDAPVLLAHHADDQAETLLMRLARGTGGVGLAGMRPANPPFYRPLLPFTRVQIAAYAKTHDVAYREDGSNATDAYTRNAFRHHVLPALATVEPRAAVGLTRSAEQQADLVAFARAAAQRILDSASEVFAKARPGVGRAAVIVDDGRSDAAPALPTYDRDALRATPGLTTLLYFWLYDDGYRSAQLTALAEWIGDGQPQRREMYHPGGWEAVVVTGARVFRERK